MQLLITSLLCLLGLVPSLEVTPVHQFHVSKSELQYRPAEKSLTMVVHIFIDDLEVELKTLGYDSMYLCTEKETPEANSILGNFFTEEFQFIIDNQPVSFDFLGKEPSDDLTAVWCYLEATEIAPFTSATIQNNILLQSFDDQKNILSFEFLGKKKDHFLFTRGEEIQTIEM